MSTKINCMKTRVRIIDTLSYSTFHEMFNASVVYMCMLIFHQVELRCSFSTWDNIKLLLARHRPNADVHAVKYHSVGVVQRDDTWGGLLKYILSGWMNFWHYLLAPRSCQLVYMNNNPLSLWWVVLANYVLKKDVAIFCHGELDLLIRRPKVWKPSFFYKYLFLGMFRYGYVGKHVKMFVLGDSILHNLLPFLNQRNRTHFCAVEHPYFFHEQSCESHALSLPLKIGTVGTMTEAKGLRNFLKLALQTNPAHVRLSVVGRVMEPIDFAAYPQVNFLAKGDRFIPRDKYEKGIDALDYILFLYPTDSYGLIASGAIFDALDMGKPIITLTNQYFNHVLRLPVGYVVSSLEELQAVVDDNCVNLSEAERKYKAFLLNIEQLKQFFMPETVSVDFQAKLQ